MSPETITWYSAKATKQYGLSAGRPGGQAEVSSKRNIFGLVVSKLIVPFPGTPVVPVSAIPEPKLPSGVPDVAFPGVTVPVAGEAGRLGLPVPVEFVPSVDGPAAKLSGAVEPCGAVVAGAKVLPVARLEDPGSEGAAVLGPVIPGAVEAAGKPGSSVAGVAVDDTGTTDPCGAIVAGETEPVKSVAGLVDPGDAVVALGRPGVAVAGVALDDTGTTEPSGAVVAGYTVLEKMLAVVAVSDANGAPVLGPTV